MRRTPYAGKLKLLWLKEIIERETDWQHGLTMRRILELLALHGVYAERKSVYTDFDTLISWGMDIQRPSGSDKEYKLLSREFEVEELETIVAALFAYEPLAKDKALHIARKLKVICSRMEGKQISNQIYEAMKIKK